MSASIRFLVSLTLITASNYSFAQNAKLHPVKVLSVVPGVELTIDKGANDGIEVSQLLFRDADSKEVIEVAEVLPSTSRCLIFHGGEKISKGDELQRGEPLDITGICHAGGIALADVTIRVFRPSSNYADEAKIVFETKSDEKGLFKLPTLTPIRNWRGTDLCIAFEKTNFVSKIYGVLHDVEQLNIDLEENPGTITGLLIDSDNNPIVGAIVNLPGRWSSLPGFQETKTDAKGKFQLTGLQKWNPPVGSSRPLAVAHPDFGKSYVYFSKIPTLLKTKIPDVCGIQGNVVDEVTGKPAVGVLVSAQGTAKSGWYETRTDNQGKYELWVQPDRYNIWAAAPDRIPIAVDSFTAATGETREGANIRLVKGGFVTGRYLNEKGGVILGDGRMRVAHYGPARPRSGAGVTSAKIASDGTYRLRVAPGDNYVYLMTGNGSSNIHIEDGQTLELDFRRGKLAAAPMREKIKVLAEMVQEAEARLQPKPGQTITSALLERLEQQNKDRQLRFSEEWLLTLKQLVDQGPEAVPELCKALDETDSDMMMRCMGFVLRAIDDPRAVPALIRAIPKTLLKPGSDMGLKATVKELREFAFANDIGESTNSYSFGRPVREVTGTIQKLTDHDLQDDQLYSIFKSGTEQQITMRQKLFELQAIKWADWWEANAKNFDVPEEYQTVNLPEFDSMVSVAMIQPDQRIKTRSGGSNWMLESALAPNAKRVFMDFDTSRVSALPAKWKNLAELPMKEIEEWAMEEGFDMMGTQVVVQGVDHPIYALHMLGMQAWQLNDERWKAKFNDISLEELQSEGTQVKEAKIFHRAGEQTDYEKHATFLAITREGTPLLLFLGVPVYDDSLQPGGVAQGDNELRTIAFRKGRKFAFAFFESLK